MLHIEKWAQGRPRFLAILAHTFAIFPEDLFELIESIKTGEIYRHGLPLIPLQEWLLFYKSHRQVLAWLREVLGDSSVDFQTLDLINETPQKAGDKNQEDPLEEFKDFLAINQEHFEKTYRQHLVSVQEDIQHKKLGEHGCGFSPLKPIPSASNALTSGGTMTTTMHGSMFTNTPETTNTCSLENEHELATLMAIPAAQFFLRVWFPCYNLYGTTPVSLMRRARQGNAKALDQLFRLDKSSIFDPKIAQIMHRLSIQNPSRYEGLLDSLRKPIKGRFDRKKIKASLAANICFLFETFGHKLTESEIRDLFDCVSKDYGRGDIDTDLPDGPDSFSKAIRREIPFWETFYRSDKK